jgi:hypothetical protein
MLVITAAKNKTALTPAATAKSTIQISLPNFLAKYPRHCVAPPQLLPTSIVPSAA